MHIMFTKAEIEALVAGAERHISTKLSLGPGNLRFFHLDREAETERRRKAEAATFKFQADRETKQQTEEIPFIINNAHIYKAGFCYEFAVLALHYLYKHCDAKKAHWIHSAAFYQPQYAVGKNPSASDHVFIVFNCTEETAKLPLSQQPDDIYIYDPWVHELYQANKAQELWEKSDGKLYPYRTRLFEIENWSKEMTMWGLKKVNIKPIDTCNLILNIRKMDLTIKSHASDSKTLGCLKSRRQKGAGFRPQQLLSTHHYNLRGGH